ncbi:tRNA (adenosine(37)-N6)-dimethylallyltransferase MiaA [Aliiroseovarius sp. PTFE2010]|uniref:tRNA (adenosine(37)-N6)-dimethylallyltransferase MiaA n=1 Tax=Aliiroseovarius sp. PTFE2010 TaxID=3417190 RepID=UPI003CF3CACA
MTAGRAVDSVIERISAELPVLIAGPTASGKSALALRIAESQGGVIVNADALQVYDNWRILTARPTPDDETRARHELYGHVPGGTEYSVGHWLRDTRALLGTGRPIIVGGTGLYFTALTEGLVDIPPTPPRIRAEADARVRTEGHAALLAELDTQTANKVDPLNPMRVQRAWEVLQTTGRGLAAWQTDTPAPDLPLNACFPILLDADRDWLAERIDRRFDQMLDEGALDEARANLPDWDAARLSSKAIGAPELVSFLRGEIDLDTARSRAQAATRQFAKRQRTWFRGRMRDWHKILLP